MNPCYNRLPQRTRVETSRWSTRFFTTMAALVTLLALTGSAAWAQLLYEENFNYSSISALVGQGGWVQTSPASTPTVLVSSPGLSLTGYASSGIGNSVRIGRAGEDVNHAFTQQTSGSVYMSALVSVDSTQTTGDYFLHFSPTPVGSAFFARVFVKKDATTSNFGFGVQFQSAGVVYTPTTFAPGQYLIVVKYTFVPAGASNDKVDLFVNPVIGAAEPAPTLTHSPATADAAGVGAVCLRQGGSGNSGVERIDGIRVGTDWNTVVAGTFYRSAASSSWGTAATWESSSDNATWAAAAAAPDASSGTITVRSPHTVTVAASTNADQLTIDVSGDVTVGGGQTFTIADGPGIDALVHGKLETSGTITNNGQVSMGGGTLQINDGGWPGNTGTYSYDATGTLRFTNSGFYGVNSDATWWPASNGPAYLDVATQPGGGITLNVPRTVATSIITVGGLTTSGGSNLTAGGIVQLNSGGYVNDPITYQPGSTLIYNTGGGYGIYNEWLGGTSQPGVPYNVRIQNNAVTFDGNRSTTTLSALGNVQIDPGSSLTLGSGVGGDLNVGGNWSDNGSLNPNGRQVSFNGSAAQNITTPETFAYLNINNAAGVSLLGGNINVNNQLVFNAGKLATTTFQVAISNGATVTGAAAGQYVNGFLLKTIPITAGAGSQTFEVGDANTFAPVAVDVTAAPGNLSVLASTTAGDNPSINTSTIDPTKSVNRYWTLSSGQTGTYNATFNFAPPDEFRIQDSEFGMKNGVRSSILHSEF